MLKYLGKEVEITIERPIGFSHDGSIYTVNYGYIPNTVAEDDEEIDVKEDLLETHTDATGQCNKWEWRGPVDEKGEG